ncbi:MAG TPA: LPP20 family lipoprotein [Thermodesulfobacteriota bacterium]|nr:LPP20 family lipoprotein [Thermodesulfobacteriota bacterium]
MKRLDLAAQILSAALLLVVPAAVSAQTPLTQVIGNGEINWAEQVVRATGSGAPNMDAPNPAAARLGAERAAKADAMRNILETLKGVRIDSQTLVVNAMTQSDTVRTQVQGIVRGARVVNTRYLSDGAVEVTLEIPLGGDLAKTVLPKASFGTQPVPKAGGSVYTGVIFDARGLNLKPALSPKIVDEEGREVYGSAFVSQEWAVKYGIAGYVKDLDAAQKNDRVAANPLVVKAVKASGSAGCDLVISNADAAGMRDMSKNLSFLEQCRVLILVD